MANSKDRRKLRRQATGGGTPAAMLSPEKGSTEHPQPQRLAQLTRSGIPPRGYVLLVIVAALGLLAVYPWLAVRDNLDGSPSAQASAPFVLVNRGYVPITNLSAACNFTSTSPSVTAQFHDNDVLVRQFADALGRQRNIGIPCAQKMFDDPNRSLFPFDSYATLEVAVSYRLLGVLVHSPQRFRFQIRKTTPGQFRWAYRR